MLPKTAALTPSIPDSPEHIAFWYLRKPETHIADLRDWPRPQGPTAELLIFRPRKPRVGWRGYDPTGGPPHAA